MCEILAPSVILAFVVGIAVGIFVDMGIIAMAKYRAAKKPPGEGRLC